MGSTRRGALLPVWHALATWPGLPGGDMPGHKACLALCCAEAAA